MAGKLSFSYSKMGMYKECPQKYKFRYVLKLPEKPKYYFAFGSALHKAMEYLYSSLKPPFPPLETVLDFFEKDWESTSYADKGYASKLKESEGYLEGVRIIKAYYAKHVTDTLSPIATEFRTTVDIDGLSVIGIVDRIDYLGDGKVSILDYKTGKKISREPDQLMMYQKLMTGNKELENIVKARHPEAEKIEFANMAFYHLPSLDSQIFPPASKEEMDDFWARVLGVAADIKAGKFAPDPGETKCRFCDYKDMCPVWRLSPADEQSFGGEDYGQEPLQPQNPMAELSSKIDAYGKALDEAKKLEKEIISAMKENSLNRHFGKNFEVSLHKTRNIDFKDKEKTVQTLKSLNLLGKTLVPTLGTIKALLESGSLTPEQHKILFDLAEFTEEYKIICSKTED
ncbi:MAG: PD-(D/E)XK nuclease family protein [Elusimicrobia bacterium]|nr:PD-(D/E)XK nuclease family protein [Elusimicrobiota bacterium]